MKLIPQNKNVICKRISPDEKTLESGFTYKSNDIPLYEVVSVSSKARDEIDVDVGDVVIASSTGTKVELDDVEYNVFSSESIAGKIR